MIDEKKLIEELRKYDFSFMQKIDAQECIEDVINKQPKVGEWIPCSERLPEKHVDVLVDFGDECPVIAWYSYVNDTWKNSSTDIVINIDVIAWMPLPDVYDKKQTNADHIRAMTDEELKELFMLNIPCDLDENRYDDYCCGRTLDCEKCIMDWLQSEV